MNLFLFVTLLLQTILWSGCGVKKGQPYINPKAKNWASNQKLPPHQEPEQVIYLIGDAGKYKGNPLPAVRYLAFEISQHPKGLASVIFLGDNIYPKGLQDSITAPDAYQKGVEALRAQMPVVQQCKGRVIFIPGNHDWAMDHKEGMENVIRQETFLEKSSRGKINFLPNNACPGPEVVHLDTTTIVIALDTQWWLHPHQKPVQECGLKSEEVWFDRLRDSLQKYANKRIIVAGHHPFFSSGPHNHGFTAKQHLFPLTEFKKKAYIPMPIIGSVYVGLRSLWGHRQDLPHPRYQIMKKKIMDIFSTHPNLIYVSGHEHSLGYYPHELQHYILSGAGSKSSQIVKNKKALYARQNAGFAKLILYRNSAYVEYYHCTEKAMRLDFRWRIQ